MNGNQTLSRALDIIFTLAENPSTLTVAQIAEKVSIPESTAYRFIQILEQNGIVERKKKGEIALGLRILDLARSLHQQIDRKLLELSRPLMEKLSETTGETIVLAIRSGMYAVCISSMESRRLIRVVIENGRTLPLHTGATGKAILAHESPKIVDQVLERLGPGLRSTELLEDLSLIRQRGYVTTFGEIDEDVFGVAAPVFDTQNRVIASLTIAGPLSRYEDNLHLEQPLCEAARELSLGAG
ncbi:IclR family transcriptional regulator [Paenibacillus filicis]|uniref:IclR family transcriptional regulator n=1 Tax=Paenibacillus filicis TaxID=669464 RepID=A0ABU9DCH2_9BACL